MLNVLQSASTSAIEDGVFALAPFEACVSGEFSTLGSTKDTCLVLFGRASGFSRVLHAFQPQSELYGGWTIHTELGTAALYGSPSSARPMGMKRLHRCRTQNRRRRERQIWCQYGHGPLRPCVHPIEGSPDVDAGSHKTSVTSY